MATCNIKKSQTLDTDKDIDLFVMTPEAKDANSLALEKGFPYFIFNNYIFMTKKQGHFSMANSLTGFLDVI